MDWMLHLSSIRKEEVMKDPIAAVGALLVTECLARHPGFSILVPDHKRRLVTLFAWLYLRACFTQNIDEVSTENFLHSIAKFSLLKETKRNILFPRTTC